MKFAPLIVAALLAGGCAATQNAQVQPPAVTLTDLQVRDVGVFEQRYGLTLRVQNPNPEPLPITGLAYRVSLNEQDFGRGVARKTVTVPPYGETLVDVDLVSSAYQLLQRVRDWNASRTSSLKITIAGDMSVAGRGGVPFSFSGEIGNPFRSSGGPPAPAPDTPPK